MLDFSKRKERCIMNSVNINKTFSFHYTEESRCKKSYYRYSPALFVA